MATPVTVSATRIALSCLIPAMATLAGALPQGASAGATVASAALAENEGRYAEAEQLLRRVVASGDSGAAAQARTRLDALLQRQGKASEVVAAAAPVESTGDSAAPTTQGPPADPITRLIQKLDTGTKANAEVKQAISQLDDLGSLIVPHLIKALPEFGPFGIYNSLNLLRYARDDRIAITLGAMLESGRPEIVAAITGYLGRLHVAVALPLASKVAGMDVDAAALGSALGVLLEHRGNDEQARKLARRMLDSGDEAMQRALLSAMSGEEREWFGPLYDALRACDGADVRAAATFQHIEAAGLDEDGALAALAGLESADIGWRIAMLGERHPDWARIGVLGLRATPTDEKWAATRKNIVQVFEWWRAPDQALPALLELPMENRSTSGNSIEYRAHEAFETCIEKAAAAGWRLPSQWDVPVVERFVHLGSNWRSFINALPVDAEQRVMRLWRVAPVERMGMAHAAMAERRPWHDLASAAMLELDLNNNGLYSFINRDWSGASAAEVARLGEFAHRSLARGPTQHNVPSQLVQLVRETPTLPATLLIPLVEAPAQGGAWTVLCERDPRAALDYARSGRLADGYYHSLVSLLEIHGTADDLPVLLRLVRESYVNNQYNSKMMQWCNTQTPGHLDIVRLGEPDTLLRAQSKDLARMLALGAAEQVQGKDFVAALRLLPDVVPEVRGNLLTRLRALVTAEHVAALRAAARANLEGELMEYRVPNVDRYVLTALVQMLGSTGDPAVLPELRAVLARADLPDAISVAAVEALVASAGDERDATFVTLLDSPRDIVVQAALYSFGELEAGDAAMVDRAIAAIRRHGAELETTGTLFRAMTRNERVRAAKAILESEGMREFGRQVVTGAIDQLADNRDPAHVPAFALAASHRETNVRLEAAKQLGNSFDRSAVPHLLELLRDENAKVRHAAQSGLDQIANYLDQLKMWQDRFGDLPATGKGK